MGKISDMVCKDTCMQVPGMTVMMSPVSTRNVANWGHHNSHPWLHTLLSSLVRLLFSPMNYLATS